MSDDPLFDPDATPDPALEQLAATLSELRHQPRPLALPPRLASPPPRRRTHARWLAVAAAALLLTLGGALALRLLTAPDPWPLEVTAGAPTLDGAPLPSSPHLSPGGWLETDARSSARLQVADIGTLDVAPGSRLQLSTTGDDLHRLTLDRGEIHADVIAPPRLLVVSTPLADAVDLGCKYDLTVEADGSAQLHVLSGFVALETPARSVFVPEGARAATSPRTGVGTPRFDDASEDFQRALDRYDAAPDDGDLLTTLLQQARPRDTLSLWHLLFTAPSVPDRERLYDRMVALAPDRVPPGLTRQHAAQLDRPRLQAWQTQLWLSW